MSRFGLPVAAAAAVAALLYLAWPATRGGPEPARLTFPEAVDAGEVPFGAEVPISVPIANKTDRPIRLAAFRTSCGCMAPSVRTAGGQTEPLGEAVTLAAGGELSVVIVLRAQAAAPTFAYTFGFETDHPDVPSATVALRGRVALGVSAAPNLIAFDTVAPGETVTATVEVADLRAGPDRGPIDVRADEPSVAARDVTPADRAGGRRTYAVSLRPEAAGRVSGKLTVRSAAGVPLGEIPYAGHVVARAHLVPSVVVLPRPGQRDPDSARVSCRSASPVARLEVTSVPPGLDVRVDGSDLVVRRDAARLNSGSAVVEAKVIFGDGRESPLTLRVTVREAEGDPTGRP